MGNFSPVVAPPSESAEFLIQPILFVLSDEVDILKLINITAKDPGVSIVQGPIKNFPAYKFRLPYGNVPVANSSAVTSAMSRPSGFTVIFLFRQQKNNLGTLISINSPGRLTPWFQINSNLRTGVLTLKYKMNASSKLHQVDWPLPGHHRKTPLAAWTWMSLSADYYSGTLRLDLDCLPSKFHQLASKTENAFISIPGDSLVYFRQEPGRKKKFLGSIQVAKVLPYVTQQRLWSCLQISENLSPEHVKPLV
ncbi:kielin/chordin-like protein [Agrilus planipennis]|uniref:Kielin/chordin-like protein n=1 Tax=Agrilus planipennis TaxID=224129 RepID=A0A7F5R757_AGRPL|nr:kielin/chordin-like protein [Agrilus planipennis]